MRDSSEVMAADYLPRHPVHQSLFLLFRVKHSFHEMYLDSNALHNLALPYFVDFPRDRLVLSNDEH